MSESESQRPTALLKKESEIACLTGSDLFDRRPVPVLTNGHTDFCSLDFYCLFVPIQDPSSNDIGINSLSVSESQRPTALLKKESEIACLAGTDLFIRRPVPVLTNGHTAFCASKWYCLFVFW